MDTISHIVIGMGIGALAHLGLNSLHLFYNNSRMP